jgi:hypothetical protein
MTIGGMYYCHMKNKRKDALYGKVSESTLDSRHPSRSDDIEQPDPTAVTDVTLHGEASTQWRCKRNLYSAPVQASRSFFRFLPDLL